MFLFFSFTFCLYADTETQFILSKKNKDRMSALAKEYASSEGMRAGDDARVLTPGSVRKGVRRRRGVRKGKGGCAICIFQLARGHFIARL